MGHCSSICFEKGSFDVIDEGPPNVNLPTTFLDATPVYPDRTITSGRTVRNVFITEDEHNPYMGYPRRGVAVIFNHEKFQPSLHLTRRVGTQVDLDELSKVLKELKFDVEEHNDFTTTEIQNRLQEVSAMDHNDCDCLVVVVMSHGMQGDNLYAYDSVYPSTALWTPFTGDKCPSLAGKPKIFIIQACRGKEYDLGIKPQKKPQYVTDGNSHSSSIPIMADLFIAYSTYEGFVSWRDTENGSWFIQELCKCLRENHNRLDLQRIMTRVCHRVATAYESHSQDITEDNTMKQMPNIQSTLLHEVYF